MAAPRTEIKTCSPSLAWLVLVSDHILVIYVLKHFASYPPLSHYYHHLNVHSTTTIFTIPWTSPSHLLLTAFTFAVPSVQNAVPLQNHRSLLKVISSERSSWLSVQSDTFPSVLLSIPYHFFLLSTYIIDICTYLLPLSTKFELIQIGNFFVHHQFIK